MKGSVAEILTRLTALSQELAGAFRPATIVEIVARVLTEQLVPGRLSVMLLDVDSNRLVVTYHNGPRPATTDDPLLQLALRRGPLVFSDKVAARAAELDVPVEKPVPSSWLGVPIVAVSRTIGAVAMEGDTQNPMDEGALVFTRAVLAQAGIALENARLVELLSSGKREWEQTVDAFNQAICYIGPQGAVRRANRMFAELIKLPPTHPLFAGGWNTINRVTYTPAALKDDPNLEQPEFHGLFLDGRLAVLYTPFDLMSGVNRESNAYARGLAGDDALRLAVNIITYALSH